MNKKIKVIELLNKIANGEELPKEIKYNFETFYIKYDTFHNIYFYETKDGTTLLKYIYNTNFLLDEVEILEDNTEEIEELKIDENGFIKTNNGTWKGRKLDVAFADKINELIKAVN